MSGEEEQALVVEINTVKATITKLEQKIDTFDADPSPKDEFAKQNYLADKRRLAGLEMRLNGLYDLRDQCKGFNSLISPLLPKDLI